MTSLEKLIQQLCPDGVEYITIGNLIRHRIISVITPTIKVKRNDYLDTGKTPVVSQEIEYISGYCNLIDKNIPCANYVCFGDHSEHIKYVDFAFVQGADGLKIMRTDEMMVSARYLFHVLSNFYQCHNNYERHFKYLTDTTIPVPPLPVQREIVRILDNFTELTAELTARRKQYEYYRDSLLEQTVATNKVLLNSVCDVYDGTHQTPVYTEAGVPFISVEDIDNIYATKKYISQEAFAKFRIKPQIGDVFMTRITAGIIGKCAVVVKDDDLAYYVSLALLRPNHTVLNSKYLKHYLESGVGRSELAKRILWNATPTKINKDDIGKIFILLPPLDAQERIVSILDRFDALCNDLTSGLPAEIEARKKQYEYYRDKLLTFQAVE